MTLQLLNAGLQKLIADDTMYAAEAKQALTEIREIQQRVGRQDVFKGECYVLHADTAIDLLSVATYDEYGKLYRKAAASNHDVSFNAYESACRNRLGLEYAPLSVIQTGYEVIADLYDDNEDNDCHNPDGTFRYENTTDLQQMFTPNGLKILYEAIQPTLNQLFKETEEDPFAEPANERLAVLSNLHMTLEHLI